MGAIRTVLAGNVHLSPRIASRLVSKMVDGAGGSGRAGALESLTDREFEVFSLIGRGVGPSAIAEKLHVSIKTVETYRENVKAKLKLKDARALVRAAMQYAMGEEITREEDRRP
jgi:DNA-binding NarL/FixJ family response regulator